MDYANPTLGQVLDAVPMLQWRECHECGTVALFRDNTVPACTCRRCGSNDTRIRRHDTQRLHAIHTEPPF